MTPAPQWIRDAFMDHFDTRDPNTVAAQLADRIGHKLLNNLPQAALLTLADVACHRAQFEGSDASRCAADLVKSIMEVLAAGDTVSGDTTSALADAWSALAAAGVPMGDEGKVFTLAERINWLDRSRDRRLREENQRLIAKVAELEAKIEDMKTAHDTLGEDQ